MEWSISHLSPLGQWIYLNPFGFLSIGTVIAVLFIGVKVFSTATRKVPSVIVDRYEQPMRFSTPSAWKLKFAIVVVLLSSALSYGGFRYINSLLSKTGQTCSAAC